MVPARSVAVGRLGSPGHPAGAGSGQNYPNRPIRVIVPFPAGGPTDGMARIISDRLGRVLGQSIVIENRGGGAGGSVGAKVVAAAEPDGYTIMITPGGSLTNGPAVHKNIGYDPVKTRAGRAADHRAADPHRASVVAGQNRGRARRLCQGQSGKLIAGSQGAGTGPHLLIELFKL